MEEFISNDFTAALQPLIADVPKGQVMVLCDSNTCAFREQLSLQHYPTCVLEAGEESKSLKGLETIWQFLLEHEASRHAVLINIGGGMITDIGGLAASTWKRGINFIQVPTTLLAMVDASQGGKTGINFGGVKNCVGTFSQPMATWICLPLLRELPAKEWLSGWGEVLKTALLSGETLWHKVQQYAVDEWSENKEKELQTIVEACMRYKRQVVEADPYEQGLRQVLNFGHTVGHALEEVTHERHGYCVVWGMVAELYLSVVHRGCPKEVLTDMTHIMVYHYGRPQCDCKQHDTLLQWMRQDKKNGSPDAISFTLLRDIGKAEYGIALPPESIREALEYLFSI